MGTVWMFPTSHGNDSDLLSWFCYTVRFPVQSKDPGMMEQPVEKGRGHDTVPHHLGPGLEALVRGHDDGDLFVQLVDQVEEQVRLPLLDRRVADLVDDNQVRLHDPPDAVFGGFLHLRGLEQLDEVGHPLEADLVAFLHGRPAEGDGQMRLPDSGRTEKK